VTGWKTPSETSLQVIDLSRETILRDISAAAPPR